MRRLAVTWRWGALLLWVLYMVAGSLVCLAGQNWPPVAKLVYLPPLFGPLLLACYALPGWWFGRKWAAVLIWTAVIALGPGLGWRSHAHAAFRARDDGPFTLNVVTVNRGQHHGHEISPFLWQQQPDVVAIQDGFTPVAYPAGAKALLELPHVVRLGEFVLVSRFPVRESSLLKLVARRKDGSVRTWFHSARHLLETPGGKVVVFNVHLPSPRFALTGGKGPEALREDYWGLQGQVMEELLRHIESETLPTVVLGDWNIPALGPRYRRMSKRLIDAHAVAGQGYGFTVPGDVKHWLAFWRPWLRLDYVFTNRQWDVERCVTEPESQAQHAAVSARLRLR